MISSLVWVRRGAAQRHPTNFNITDEAELQRVQKLTHLEFGDAQAQLEQAKKEALQMGQEGGGDYDDDDDDRWEDENGEESGDADAEDAKMDTAEGEDPDDLAKYNLDTYDEEQSQGIAMGAFSNIKGLQFYKSNDDDPYITLKDGDDEADDAEDREALEILPTDNLVISAKTEDEVSMIEAHVYAKDSGDGEDAGAESTSLYVHHDLLLPSFPLCLEWVGASPASKEPANLLAVSTMEPEVELWNMDVINGLVPDVVLGDRPATKAWEKQAKKLGTGKKKRRELAPRPKSALHHTDAVLCISWNSFVPNLLLTSSADSTIKLWDLSAQPAEHGGINAIRSFDTVHADKVQSVAWNNSGVALGSDVATDRSLVASGGYDGFVKVWDVRQPDAAQSVQVSGEVERIRWHPWKPNVLLVALDNGLVQAFDGTRLSAGALWTLSAHEGGCTSLDLSTQLPGCLLTAGLDRTLKLWNIEDGQDGGKPNQISLATSRDVGAGKIFTAAFSPDEPLTVAAAGSSGSVKVWDALGAKGVGAVFGQRLKEWEKRVGQEQSRRKQGGGGGEGEEEGVLVEVEEDEEDSSDEEDSGEDAGEGEGEGAAAAADGAEASMEE